jgi:hypothetical protein
MPDHSYVYKKQAHQYDLMISRQPDLLSVINEIRSVQSLLRFHFRLKKL